MISKKSLLTADASLPLLDFLILKEMILGGCPKEQLSFDFTGATGSDTNETVLFKVSFAVDLGGTKLYTDNQQRLSQILMNVSKISNEIREILKEKISTIS